MFIKSYQNFFSILLKATIILSERFQTFNPFYSELYLTLYFYLPNFQQVYFLCLTPLKKKKRKNKKKTKQKTPKQIREKICICAWFKKLSTDNFSSVMICNILNAVTFAGLFSDRNWISHRGMPPIWVRCDCRQVSITELILLFSILRTSKTIVSAYLCLLAGLLCDFR